MTFTIEKYKVRSSASAVFILFHSSIRVNSYRKTYAPLGANFFLSEQTYLERLRRPGWQTEMKFKVVGSPGKSNNKIKHTIHQY